MRKTGLLFDQRYMLHETGPFHPETADRLVAVFRGLKDGGLLDKLLLIQGSPAERRWIETVHDSAYIDSFNDACIAGRKEFEHPDNQMCCDSFDTALAVGGVLDTAAFIMRGDIDNAFCAVRPPGHHAEHAKSMGFCYFNNIAVAARYLQHEWGVQRVGIIDFDVHHGNGTQHIFEADPTVFYYSIHQHPSFTFPGTGREFEQGSGEGFGFTKNTPVLPGQGDAEYKQLITRDLLPAFDKFAPQVILVSSGFDAHVDDEMADMRVSTEGFTWIIQTIVGLAERHCGGKLISILEGGYNLKRLPELIAGHVRVLLGID
jgi:acetoin utilization deacetylase AcuC-like enzyme